MAHRPSRRVPVVRGEMQSPVVISPESIEALLNGMLSSLPAAIGAAVDSRMQGRKLLQEIARGQRGSRDMLRDISGGIGKVSGKLDIVIEKLDGLRESTSREHGEILRAVGGS